MSKLRVSVENFGPVRQGTFELSPLTIFIGPNNSGKSYVALLLYVLCKAVTGTGLHSRFDQLYSRRSRASIAPSLELLARNRVTLTELHHWLRSRVSTKGGKLVWRELPASVQVLFRQAMEAHAGAVGLSVSALLGDYFAVHNFDELVRSGSSRGDLSIRISQRGGRSVLFDAKLAPESDNWEAAWRLPSLRSLAVEVAELFGREAIDDPDSPFPALELFDRFWQELIAARGFPRGNNAYYLPSARSGILGAWQVFASMAVDITRRRFGLELIQVPAFTGVTGDFLQTLFGIVGRRRSEPELQNVLEALDTHIFQGEVTFLGRGPAPPPIVYSTRGTQLPIHRASSMVGELAPLSLWVQHVLRRGDLVIIDEPEAHLHPENQRRIATVLVRLVQAGVTVLCTTHSSLILHQLSNHILLSQAKPQERERLGFTPQDVLDAADLGVYLFDVESEGTQVKPVPIDPETGIEEEEFVRVMEAIGDETYRLAVQRDQVTG